MPWVFTEHGAIQAANVLNSRRAVEMGIYVVRAFVEKLHCRRTGKHRPESAGGGTSPTGVSTY